MSEEASNHRSLDETRRGWGWGWGFRQGRVVQEVRQLRPEDTGCRVGEKRPARVWVGRGTSIQNERAGAAEEVWWLGGGGWEEK